MRNSLILLVEDDENNVLFTKLAFEHNGLPNPFLVVKDGPASVGLFQRSTVRFEPEEED